MRIHYAMPVLAALALAACGGSADEELQGEALSAEEVAGAASADFTMPKPGQYRTTQELIEFTMPSLPAEQMEMARNAFVSGAAEQTTYCVTEEMTREEWLSGMAESDCTVSRSDAGGNAVDMVLSCSGAEGVSGRMALKGTTTEEGSDMEMTFTQAIPGAGDSTIRMRVKSERVGDCA